MTDRGHELGLKGSVFKNATGLHDPEHVMTARDLALLARPANDSLRVDHAQVVHVLKQPQVRPHRLFDRLVNLPRIARGIGQQEGAGEELGERGGLLARGLADRAVGLAPEEQDAGDRDNQPGQANGPKKLFADGVQTRSH